MLDRGPGVARDPIPSTRRIVTRHLTGQELPTFRGLRLRHGVLEAAPPIGSRPRRDGRAAIRRRVVPDPEIDAALRADQHRIAARERVVGRDRQDRRECREGVDRRVADLRPERSAARAQDPQRRCDAPQEDVRSHDRRDTECRAGEADTHEPGSIAVAHGEQYRDERRGHFEHRQEELAFEVDEHRVRGRDRGCDEARAAIEESLAEQVDEHARSRADHGLHESRREQSFTEHACQECQEPRITRGAEERPGREVLAANQRARPLEVVERVHVRGIEEGTRARLQHVDDAQRESHEYDAR